MDQLLVAGKDFDADRLPLGLVDELPDLFSRKRVAHDQHFGHAVAEGQRAGVFQAADHADAADPRPDPPPVDVDHAGNVVGRAAAALDRPHDRLAGRVGPDDQRRLLVPEEEQGQASLLDHPQQPAEPGDDDNRRAPVEQEDGPGRGPVGEEQPLDEHHQHDAHGDRLDERDDVVERHERAQPRSRPNQAKTTVDEHGRFHAHQNRHISRGPSLPLEAQVVAHVERADEDRQEDQHCQPAPQARASAGRSGRSTRGAFPSVNAA